MTAHIDVQVLVLYSTSICRIPTKYQKNPSRNFWEIDFLVTHLWTYVTTYFSGGGGNVGGAAAPPAFSFFHQLLSCPHQVWWLFRYVGPQLTISDVVQAKVANANALWRPFKQYCQFTIDECDVLPHQSFFEKLHPCLVASHFVAGFCGS